MLLKSLGRYNCLQHFMKNICLDYIPTIWTLYFHYSTKYNHFEYQISFSLSQGWCSGIASTATVIPVFAGEKTGVTWILTYAWIMDSLSQQFIVA